MIAAELARHINRPLQIGGHVIENRLALAPMAGLGHLAFRDRVRAFGGCGLLFMEMLSARAVPTENPERSECFRWREAERDRLVAQIVGSEPEVMATAARRIESLGLFGVDINFGCSASGICKRGWGAALLKTPDAALRIVDAVRNAVSIPVSVKFRTGWQPDPEPAVRLARKFEAAGCDFLTFHPRISPDKRSRPPRWDHIRLVTDAVSIPVYGNGNLFTEEDALRMLDATGCDGLSVGRMAIARPWIFAEWSGRLDAPPSMADHLTGLAAEFCKEYGEVRGIKLFRKQLPYAMANYVFGHTMHAAIRKADGLGATLSAIETVLKDAPPFQKHPNTHLFTY